MAFSPRLRIGSATAMARKRYYVLVVNPATTRPSRRRQEPPVPGPPRFNGTVPTRRPVYGEWLVDVLIRGISTSPNGPFEPDQGWGGSVSARSRRDGRRCFEGLKDSRCVALRFDGARAPACRSSRSLRSCFDRDASARALGRCARPVPAPRAATIDVSESGRGGHRQNSAL